MANTKTLPEAARALAAACTLAGTTHDKEGKPQTVAEAKAAAVAQLKAVVQKGRRDAAALSEAVYRILDATDDAKKRRQLQLVRARLALCCTRWRGNVMMGCAASSVAGQVGRCGDEPL